MERNIESLLSKDFVTVVNKRIDSEVLRREKEIWKDIAQDKSESSLGEVLQMINSFEDHLMGVYELNRIEPKFLRKSLGKLRDLKTKVVNL